MKEFNIEVVVQPAQSPDVNVDDLAFFRSLQSDVSLVVKENRRQLLAAVQERWEAYPAEKNDFSLELLVHLVSWRPGERR